MNQGRERKKQAGCLEKYKGHSSMVGHDFNHRTWEIEAGGLPAWARECDPISTRAEKNIIKNENNIIIDN